MTNEEFDEILERTNAVVCNREWYERAAKALEQEPSEDAVSRQAVTDAVENTIAKYIPIFIGRYEKIPLELALAIKDVPPVTPAQKWIPVSERLPKAGEYVDDVAKYYLVQNEYGDMLVARYTHSGYWEQIYQLQPIADEIVSWMPLPEPYKAESEE